MPDTNTPTPESNRSDQSAIAFGVVLGLICAALNHFNVGWFTADVIRETIEGGFASVLFRVFFEGLLFGVILGAIDVFAKRHPFAISFRYGAIIGAVATCVEIVAAALF